jgi:ubiquinone/menaquinone biosynthesis C-methylase UbiE
MFIDIQEGGMTRVEEQNSMPATGGIVLHAARFYDFMAWALMLGREGAFREKVIELARLRPGESVLDAGCGTGTLAIAAKRRVGSMGKVYGIDASPEMIGRAREKARKAGLDVEFKNEVIEGLTFPEARFDAVLNTLMLHHLPRRLRDDGAREIRRVLRPGGRVLVVDFGGTEQHRGFLAHFHPRHGQVKPAEVAALLNSAGLNVVDSGAVGVKDLHFTLAIAPCAKS